MNIILFLIVIVNVLGEEILKKLSKDSILNFNNINLPNNFSLLNDNILLGPITINKTIDDGTKRNLYSIVKFDDYFYYNYTYINLLEDVIPRKPEYFCELGVEKTPESQKGYEISCPSYYSIKIKDVFYGRFANDKKRCKIFNGKKVSRKRLKLNEKYGYIPLKEIKELCEGKSYCKIVPNKDVFRYKWEKNIHKYLYISYYCKKNEVII